jgi:hypothetical protein
VEKILNEILLKLDNLDRGQNALETGQNQIVARLATLETDVKEVRDVVTRIEVSQNEDVIAKTEALNKRLFHVESRMEASK